MSRVQIELPTQYCFHTAFDLLINHINYGGHLGNDAVLSLAQEARLRFLRQWSYSELEIEGCGILVADAAIVFCAEAFYGERVHIDLAVQNFTRCACEMLYRLRTEAQEIARVKTGLVFFDYQQRTVVAVPTRFRERVVALSP
jgi:acyl-CoA thioesterase FadM